MFIHLLSVWEQGNQGAPLGSTKVPILKEDTSEKCKSVELITFSTYLSSLLAVIAIVFSNHALK